MGLTPTPAVPVGVVEYAISLTAASTQCFNVGAAQTQQRSEQQSERRNL